MKSLWLWLLGLLWILGLALILVPTGLYLYLVTPFPGSQSLDWIDLAYRAKHAMPWTRELGAILVGLALLLALVPVLRGRRPGWRKGAGIAVGVLLAGLGLYAPYMLDAGRVFQPPKSFNWAQGTSAAIPATSLVLGVEQSAEARAYPLRLLIYHHAIENRIGEDRLWVTYCGMCRTGRVYRPVAGDQTLTFELLGALHHNSFYEDRETGSWWYQADGLAFEGPLEGTRLEEVPSEQMTLGQWLKLHPTSLVMQPDPDSAEGYGGTFASFDTWKPGPDGGPHWQEEGGRIWNWVVAVHTPDEVRVWPWGRLTEERLIQDEIGDIPVAVYLSDDGQSFRAWDRRLAGHTLDLHLDPDTGEMVDEATGARFGFDGLAHGGELDGLSLKPVRVTQEYRHAVERFASAAEPGGGGLTGLDGSR